MQLLYIHFAFHLNKTQQHGCSQNQLELSSPRSLRSESDPRSRVENSVGLAEFGDAWTEFYSSVDGLPVARGYDRIVYGDHGPYVDA